MLFKGCGKIQTENKRLVAQAKCACVSARLLWIIVWWWLVFVCRNQLACLVSRFCAAHFDLLVVVRPRYSKLKIWKNVIRACNSNSSPDHYRSNSHRHRLVIATVVAINTKPNMTQTEQNQFSKPWELSPYELHRRPQELITDNTEIAVSPRSLHSELMCPICLDMLKTTMTTKECLHRFCQECIITALRSGNKECPTCRKKLISKRSLRPDPNFDMLISKIYPSRDEYEAQQERVIAKVNKQNFVHNYEETIRLQSLNRTRNKRNNDDNGKLTVFFQFLFFTKLILTDNRKRVSNSPSDNNESYDNMENEDVKIIQEIELIIKPLPQVERRVR